MRVDLPEPDTPVTQVNNPTGILACTDCKLLPRAPMISKKRSFTGMRFSGTAIASRPERYAPVKESVFASTSAGVPWATISPP